MPTVISSLAQATGRGIFIVYRKAAGAAKAVGTGRAVMVAQLPWGPLDTETPYSDPSTFRAMFAPEGFTRTGAGYLMATKFRWVDLQVVRVLGASPVKATIAIADTVPATALTVNALYYGSGGTGITAVVATASNGVSTSFNLTVQKMDTATGLNTTELYANLDSTLATSHTNWTTVVASSKLIGPLVRATTTRPVNGTYTLASGSDGSSIASSNYLGTPGAGDKGVAVLEKDPNVSFLFTDDPGSSILAAVMAGVKAHATLMSDRRIAILMGNAAETSSTAATNAALNTGDHVAYAFPHGIVRDDNGANQTIPLTGPLASLCTLMTPHLSPAYKSTDFTQFMSELIDLDQPTANATTKDTLEKAGVIVFEKNSETDNSFSPYNDVMADAVTPMFATRMKDFITFSVAGGLTQYKNSPNDTETQEDERTIFKRFLDNLKANRTKDHIFLPCINDFTLYPIESSNTQSDIDNGDFYIQFQAKLISSQKKIFLLGEIGTTVTIKVVSQ